MTVRTLYAAALGLGLCATSPALSQGQEAVPGRLQLPAQGIAELSNQQTADAIAQRLRQSPRLSQYRVHVSFREGVADLTGTVQDAGQREEVLRLAQAVPGVAQVRDHLQVMQGSGVVQTQAPPLPVQPVPQVPVPPVQTAPFVPPMPNFAPPGQPGMPPLPNVGGIQEPLPLQQQPPGFPSNLQPPPMPPYAWPTYAPYNNVSRVAYPTLYPYESWPYIGPVYPFPKVPLGWRSVSLTWEDGHWWYGRNATGHDWWRIRYW